MTLTVWSVLWGEKYPPVYVQRLKAMVERHLPVTHRFVCLTSHQIAGVDTVEPPTDWPGWWQKLSLFSVASGPSLYLDLDVLVDGDLSDIASYSRHRLAMPLEFGHRRHRAARWNSSVMVWDGMLRSPPEGFDPALLVQAEAEGHCRYGPERLWGDQEYLTRHHADEITTIPDACGIVSWRAWRHRGGPPQRSRVVCFHGRPNYHELPRDPWVSRVLRGLPV